MAITIKRPTTTAQKAQRQAALYYARKRSRARSEATAGNGGFRTQRPGMGVVVRVTLTTV